MHYMLKWYINVALGELPQICFFGLLKISITRISENMRSDTHISREAIRLAPLHLIFRKLRQNLEYLYAVLYNIHEHANSKDHGGPGCQMRILKY